MINSFLHNSKLQYETHLQKCCELFELYNQKSFQFEKLFIDLADELTEFFDSTQAINRKTEILEAKAEYITARGGYNPINSEKISYGRRANIWITSYRCLIKVSEILEFELGQIKESLSETIELLGQILLAALQNGQTTLEELISLQTQSQIMAFWDRLKNEDFPTMLMEKKMLLKANQYDILILLDQILKKWFYESYTKKSRVD
jgi:hypothetical protein